MAEDIHIEGGHVSKLTNLSNRPCFPPCPPPPWSIKLRTDSTQWALNRSILKVKWHATVLMITQLSEQRYPLISERPPPRVVHAYNIISPPISRKQRAGREDSYCLHSKQWEAFSIELCSLQYQCHHNWKLNVKTIKNSRVETQSHRNFSDGWDGLHCSLVKTELRTKVMLGMVLHTWNSGTRERKHEDSQRSLWTAEQNATQNKEKKFKVLSATTQLRWKCSSSCSKKIRMSVG